MKFLAKNKIILTLFFLIFSCTNEPKDTPVSVYCNVINEKLYSFSRLSNFEKQKFDELKESRFLKYKNDFIEAGNAFGIEWELLAAVSFQESQWNPNARSATQVKGMMMLTLPTAASVGVTNRLDPIQSIYGGAQYISDLKENISFGTSSGDKIAFILAAYNLGITNVNLAVNQLDKKKIDVTWLDLEEYLLNLKTPMDSENYTKGQQTVDFVERIRDYYFLLLAQNCSDE